MLAGPGDAAQQHLLDLIVAEVGVGVALHPDEGTCGLSAGECVLVGPDLRGDFALVCAGAGGCRRLRLSRGRESWDCDQVMLKKASSRIVKSVMPSMMGLVLSTMV